MGGTIVEDARGCQPLHGATVRLATAPEGLTVAADASGSFHVSRSVAVGHPRRLAIDGYPPEPWPPGCVQPVKASWIMSPVQPSSLMPTSEL